MLMNYKERSISASQTQYDKIIEYTCLENTSESKGLKFFKFKSEMQANKKNQKQSSKWKKTEREEYKEIWTGFSLYMCVCVYFILFLSKSKHTLKAALQLSSSLHSGLLPLKQNTPP